MNNSPFDTAYTNLNNLVSDFKKEITSRGLLDITIDSREVTPHHIFVALKGTKVDGQKFIPQAVAQGCQVIFTYLTEAEQQLAQNLSTQATTTTNTTTTSTHAPSNEAHQVLAQEYPVIATISYSEIHEQTVLVVKILHLEQYLSFIALKFFDFLYTLKYPESLGLDIPVIGVTGTNGKTLTTNLIAQGLILANHDPAVTNPYVIGTVGLGQYPNLSKAINTTPDACTVMREIFYAQILHARATVMEVSSHGLALNRVSNVRFNQAIFTNLTQDHLDFHHTFEEYFMAKAALFTSHNVKDYIITCNGEANDYGARLVDMVSMKLCVTDQHTDHSRGTPAFMPAMMALQGAIPTQDHLAGSANSRPNPLGSNQVHNKVFLNDLASRLLNLNYQSRIAVVNIGTQVQQQTNFKADIILTLTKVAPRADGLEIAFDFEDKLQQRFQSFNIRSPLLGLFNAYNLATTFVSLYMQGVSLDSLPAIVAQLHAVNGRMQVVPNNLNRTIIIDFAHTSDALEKALTSARAHFDTNSSEHGKMWVIFGCGGDRDTGKRPIMGAVARRLADNVIITDDNPRSEDAALIANQVLNGCREAGKGFAMYIAGRDQAIAYALDHSNPGDMIMIAGKGHETEQVLADKTIHFSDYETVIKYLNNHQSQA